MKYFTEPLNNENKAILDFVLELRNNSDWKDEHILGFLDMMGSRMNSESIRRDIENQQKIKWIKEVLDNDDLTIKQSFQNIEAIMNPTKLQKGNVE